MMASIFYNALLFLGACILFPKWLFDLLWRKKHRQGFRQRFGFGIPKIEKGERPLIWLHAVSVGETKAAAALIRVLKEQLQAVLVVSSVTDTGHEEAKRSIPEADYHIYLPFDFYFIIAPIVKRIKPDIVIISESDLWYHFLKTSKNLGAFTALVNGKISERSALRFSKIPHVAAMLFDLLDLFCLQDAVNKHRFERLGVDSEKLVVTGNLKFDAAPSVMNEAEKAMFRNLLALSVDDQVITLGSTHDPEEKAFLPIFMALQKKKPSLRLIIVPRHPERFDAVATVLENEKIPYLRYSELCKNSPQHLQDKLVILIDTMGMLSKCYQVSDIAIVGGSFVNNVGGHNILEPLWFGTPVLYGHYMWAQVEIVKTVKKYEAGLQVAFDDVEKTISLLFNDENRRHALTKAGKVLIAEMQGSVARTLQAIDKRNQRT